MPAQTVIKLRRGTASQWTTANPVLAAGEVGLETDTLRTKYGNGTSAWADLSYSVADASGTSSVDWTSVLNKPSEFDPIAHAADHELGGIDEIEIAQSQVTGLSTSLAGKSDVGHTHPISDVVSLQTELDGKSNVGHTHLLADVTDYVEPEITFTNTFMLMGA